MPPAVVTVTSTVPARFPQLAGLVATIWVAESLTIVAAVDAEIHGRALARPVPVIVTVVPPATGPDEGLKAVTAGTGSTESESIGRRSGRRAAGRHYRDVDRAGNVPAGLVTTIWVAVSLTTSPGWTPNVTAVALARFVPVIVTVVPPATGPDAGLGLRCRSPSASPHR